MTATEDHLAVLTALRNTRHAGEDYAYGTESRHRGHLGRRCAARPCRRTLAKSARFWVISLTKQALGKVCRTRPEGAESMR